MKNKKMLVAIAVVLFLPILWIGGSYAYEVLLNKNFGIVVEGEIYRSSQPDENLLHQMKKDYEIKTIIVLTKRIKDFEQEFAEANTINIIHIPMKASREPSEEDVEKFLATVRNPDNFPILIHCRAGADRTGLLVAIKRIEIDGWTKEEAIAEMKKYWHVPLFCPMPTNYLEKNY